jgi:hypothetical protein
MSIEALAGVIGTVVAILALVWQVAVHRNSGHRIRVQSSYIMPVFDDMEIGDEDFIQVEVTNRGGKPATVTNYAVGLGNRKKGSNMFVLRPPAWASPLPTVAEPGGAPVRLLVPVADLQKARDSKGIPFHQMTPWIQLGDGRKVYSSNSVPMKD